jgi:cytochrome b6-f complex iron-sulfur subunit
LAKVSSIPVRGSIAATAGGKPVTLARPSAGQVVGFSAICTHMGCTVAPSGSRLNCPCHGSVYNAFTGAVINGPAPQPLPPFAVRVVDGYVVPN